jgi:hypothetical protein
MPVGLVRAGWFVVVVALVLVVGFWASQIAGTLGTTADREALPSPTPVLSVPTVVTEYSDTAPMSRAQLCAELAPGTNEVLVESALGAVIDTIKC